MSEFIAPLKDMSFVLTELADLPRIASLPGYEDMGADLAVAVLEEAGKLATGVLSPLNWIGDQHGARWHEGEVSTPPGWSDAYQQFTQGGWGALSCDPEQGGQGLPRVISCLVEEIWNSANMAFALCPMLTRGAIEALELCGSQAQKNLYLPKLISGEWTGTMNLTEPQAGSDLAAVRTRALRQADGAFRLHGQKIFITYGDHDLTDNIIHLVLARTPEAPAGVKGLSLFVVPKFLIQPDGTLGARNDVRCVSIEHKLGIHASPTAILSFGDHEGALGWLVGEENRGLEYMFIMMNAARFSVGVEGVGLCERAYQRALAYARDRVQGTELGSSSRDKVAILRHPDVRRMLLQMKSRTEALRAVATVVAAAMDDAMRNPSPEARLEAQAFVDLMIPVVKGWSTETANLVTSLGVQVHGGMGYIEETGAAQHFRDARIATIYEGTTGIQAADLVGRKIAKDGGFAALALAKQMRTVSEQLRATGHSPFSDMAGVLEQGIQAFENSVQFILRQHAADARVTAVAAVPFLELFGIVAGGWQMARAALAAHRLLADTQSDQAFLQGKLITARFYATHILPAATALAFTVEHGAEPALVLADEQF